MQGCHRTSRLTEKSSKPLASRRLWGAVTVLLSCYERRRDKGLLLLTVLVLAALYIPLQNGYWIPSNDGEFYLSVARNMATGRGYQWNGLPVAIVPPGWPLVLAAVLRVSSSFWALNLLPMILLLSTAVIYYLILRRITSPFRAFFTVLISATLFEWTRLTFIQFSDALFCFLFAVTLLLAFQIKENRAAWWRIPILMMTCSAIILVRWSGVVAWLVVAGVLVTGQVKPRANRQWACAVLSGLVVTGAFFGLRHALSARVAAAKTVELEAHRPRIETSAQSLYRIPKVDSLLSCSINLLAAGQWFSALFWAPGQMASSSRAMGSLFNVVGWVLICLFAGQLCTSLRNYEWVWLGVLGHCAVLCAVWSSTPRYLVPVAPLLLLGIWQGANVLAHRIASSLWRRSFQVAPVVFLSAVVICNATLYLVDVRVNRSEDFYATYRAGQCKELVAAAHYISQHSPEGGNTAISGSYVNLSWVRRNTFALRSLNMLLNSYIRAVPASVCSDQPNEQLLTWAAAENVRFYLYRPPVSPWRLWHFRVPWLQEKMTGNKVHYNPFWVLYERTDEGFTPVSLPMVRDWPRALPGI